MAKKSSGYISKGQRQNVARSTIILCRAWRKENPRIEDIIKSQSHRNEIIAKPRTAKHKELRERYIREDDIEFDAFKLMDQYRDVNLTRGETIQAIKTNYVDKLHHKWGIKLREFRNREKKK